MQAFHAYWDRDLSDRLLQLLTRRTRNGSRPP
jgi:hypothetical protein